MANKVLYIHMIGAFGGASRSLFEIVRAFPATQVTPYFVTPKGNVSTFFKEIGGTIIEVPGLTQFDNTRYSYYRGIRWLVGLRELIFLPHTIGAMRRAKRDWGDVDLIHLNEFTGIIPMLIARRMFNVPVVVHVRSLARNDAGSWRTKWVNHILREKASAVIAIDENVRASLPQDLRVDVIHNAFTPAPAAAFDAVFDAKLKALRPGSVKVGFVGNLLKVKGLYDLIEAARLVKGSGIDVEFVVVGGNGRSLAGIRGRFLKALGLAHDVMADLEVLIKQYELRDTFHLFGFTADIQRFYPQLDILCFPSHYDAPGRPIFEAAFSGVPSIVAVRDPKPDTLIHGETGLAVPPQDPVALASAIMALASDRKRSINMGSAARAMAQKNFDVQTNAGLVLEVYRRCLDD